jgi:hypothetical protein
MWYIFSIFAVGITCYTFSRCEKHL